MAAHNVVDEHVITLVRINSETDKLKEIWNSIKLLKKNYLFLASQIKKQKRARTGRKSQSWVPKVPASGRDSQSTSNVVSPPSAPPGLTSRNNISDNSPGEDVSASRADKDKFTKAVKAYPPASASSSRLIRGFFNKPGSSSEPKTIKPASWPFRLSNDSTFTPEPFNMALFEKGDTPESSDDEYTSATSGTRRNEDERKDNGGGKDKVEDIVVVKDKDKNKKENEKEKNKTEEKIEEKKIEEKKKVKVVKKSREVLELEMGAKYLEKYTKRK